VPAEFGEKVRMKLKERGVDVSEVLRSALRSVLGDESGMKTIDILVFDLLVGAQTILRRLADRAVSVQPGTPEAAAFFRDLSAVSGQLEKARTKARRRVNAARKAAAFQS
jgi:hypothetical protein